MKKNLLLEKIRKEISDETREEVLRYAINTIAKRDSSWLKEARRRKRNWWWKKHFNKVHLKYLILKRKIKKL